MTERGTATRATAGRGVGADILSPRGPRCFSNRSSGWFERQGRAVVPVFPFFMSPLSIPLPTPN